MTMKHILCAIDGSDPARRAVATAAAMALRMQAKLSILHVSEYVIGRSGVYDVTTPEEAQKYLAEAKAIAAAEAYDDPALTDLRARDPAHAILDFAEKNGVDLIVMGAAGKGAVKRFLIGSVSADVLRKAYCPVTIVH
jgi:nucleotide-binding universal stress UspA family protein